MIVGLRGSIGVIVSWLLLQAGFAARRESVCERLPDVSMIRFPGIEGYPTLGDSPFLSFRVEHLLRSLGSDHRCGRFDK